ncbi:Hypothetical predicted protein [Octopus vulgaris]|uniref:Uncharacterized protein n=1 Tax=Octopus vulgaris TaxID=6645 RepID=A0AA36FBL0_OCTVU|nr:Hypothetical predicted protein [Octopus vulgaris]
MMPKMLIEDDEDDEEKVEMGKEQDSNNYRENRINKCKLQKLKQSKQHSDSELLQFSYPKHPGKRIRNMQTYKQT